MTNCPRNTPIVRTIEFLTFPDVQLLDVTGPLQVFASANEFLRNETGSEPYEIKTLAQASPVRTSSGVELIAAPLSKEGTRIDTLVIAGGSGVHVASENDDLVRWATQRAAKARRVASICSGAFLLAKAGLLDNKRAVTHWAECDSLSARFSSVKVERNPIFINDSDVWTSAGVTAGIDLALALVKNDLGHETALKIARDLVVFLKRHGGQAQYSDLLALQERHGDFEELHSWISQNLAADLTVEALASQAGMSERSFVRKYKSKTGSTPARSVEAIRFEAAKAMLTNDELSIKKIAHLCGFGTEETMRRCFLRLIETGPQAYRQGFARNT